jgi:uncharacterized protein YkwD
MRLKINFPSPCTLNPNLCYDTLMFWVDLLILGLLAFGLWQGFLRGFITQLFQIISAVAALLVSFWWFPYVGSWFEKQLQIPVSYANPLALGALLIALTYIFQFIAGLLQRLVAPILNANPLNRGAGLILGGARQLLVVSFALALVISLPLSATLKQTIDKSRLSPPMIRFALGLESAMAKLFHNNVVPSLNYRVVQPDETATTALNFTVAAPTVDSIGEAKMLVLTNVTREKVGKKALIPNEALREVARNHAKDMLIRGYFSHSSPQGKDALARVQEAKIQVLAVGENLATAPTTDIAHAGLLASEGHRKNIVNPDFNAVGIGVLDAGTHGKMVVEVFAKLP